MKSVRENMGEMNMAATAMLSKITIKHIEFVLNRLAYHFLLHCGSKSVNLLEQAIVIEIENYDELWSVVELNDTVTDCNAKFKAMRNWFYVTQARAVECAEHKQT